MWRQVGDFSIIMCAAKYIIFVPYIHYISLYDYIVCCMHKLQSVGGCVKVNAALMYIILFAIYKGFA